MPAQGRAQRQSRVAPPWVVATPGDPALKGRHFLTRRLGPNQLPELNRRQQRQPRVYPLILCYLCYLLFKSFHREVVPGQSHSVALSGLSACGAIATWGVAALCPRLTSGCPFRGEEGESSDPERRRVAGSGGFAKGPEVRAGDAGSRPGHPLLLTLHPAGHTQSRMIRPPCRATTWGNAAADSATSHTGQIEQE